MFDDGRTPLDNRSSPSAQPQSDAKLLGWVGQRSDSHRQPSTASNPNRSTDRDEQPRTAHTTTPSNPGRSDNRDEQPQPVSQARRATRAVSRPRPSTPAAERSEGEKGVRVAEPPLAASAAPPHKRRRRPAPRSPRTRVAHRLRGRYWDRTSDLFRVREARYRCANRPRNPQTTEVLEVETGFEPVYTALQAVASPLGHSTTEKAGPPNPLRADDRVRTGDLNLGKVALYQLSYVRIAPAVSCPAAREEH